MTRTAPLHAPWPLAPLIAVIAQLRELDPRAVLVEGAYPFQRLSFAAPSPLWLLPAPGRSVAPHPFFGSLTINESTNAQDTLSGLAASIRKRRGSPWLVLEAEQAVELAEQMRAGEVSFLVHGSAEGDLTPLADAAQAAGLRMLRFVYAGGWAGYTAFVAPARPLPSGPAPGPVNTAPPITALLDRDGPLEIALSPATLPAVIRLNPRDLVSDCPWPAEGDEGYSWIWTGPQISHRICLGHLPQEAEALTVHFMDSPRHERLADNLRFQINGRSAAADMTRLRARSGSVRVTLLEGTEAPVVLGVCAFPHSIAPSDDGRHVRVAIEAVDVML